MQGQTHLSSLLSLKPQGAPEPGKNVNRAGDERFKRLLEAPAAQRDGLERAQQRRQVDERQAAQTSESDREQAARHGDSVNRSPASGQSTSARIDDASQGDRAVGGSGGPDAVSLTEKVEAIASEEIRTALSGLSEGELEALGEDIEALLRDLLAQLEAGTLDPEAEQALAGLLTALNQGASLEEIALKLEALPVALAPQLAERLGQGDNLRQLLGRSGAAYLAQLARETQNANGQSGDLSISAKGAEPAPSSLANLLESSQGSMLDRLLAQSGELSSGGGREQFARLLEAMAGREASGGKPTDLAQTPAASSLASLDANARSQPLQATERQFTVQSEVRVPVNQGQWGQAVGQRVLWLAAQNVSSAELRLDPPDLGPMQVRVSSHQDQISVTFTSPQVAVREALDQSATRLREMFAEQGLNLVDVNVSDQSAEQQSGEQTSGEGSSSGQGGSEPDEHEQGAVRRESAISLVDHYA